jgi:hypothetical protein
MWKEVEKRRNAWSGSRARRPAEFPITKSMPRRRTRNMRSETIARFARIARPNDRTSKTNTFLRRRPHVRISSPPLIARSGVALVFDANSARRRGHLRSAACGHNQHELQAVRKQSKSRTAAGNLQAAGLIKYSRGHIAIVDRAGLEARTCECYAVVKKESDRLLPDRIAS